MTKEHFMRFTFGITKDGTPEIYDFLFDYLEDALFSLGLKDASIKIERLEPLDRIYTNLYYPEEMIKKIFDGFAKKHHLKETKGERLDHIAKTTLKADVPVTELKKTLYDYNVLFDIFFTDIVIKSKSGDREIEVDLMDAFNNACLVASPDYILLDAFKREVKKQVKWAFLAEHIDVHPRREKMRLEREAEKALERGVAEFIKLRYKVKRLHKGLKGKAKAKARKAQAKKARASKAKKFVKKKAAKQSKRSSKRKALKKGKQGKPRKR